MIWADERSILEARAAQLSNKRENYRQTHKKNAEKKGVLREFMNAQTITQMRKILFG